MPQTHFHSDICSPENISLAYLNVTYHHIATDVICDCSFRNTSQKKFAVGGGTACQTGHCRKLPVSFLVCLLVCLLVLQSLKLIYIPCTKEFR